MSKIKEVAANGKKFTENWYYVYQPANTSIATSWSAAKTI